MDSTIKQLLTEYDEVPWFRSVGIPFPETDKAMPVAHWAEAMRVYKAQASKDSLLEAQNELSVWLAKNAPSADLEWNSRLGIIKPLVASFITEKLRIPDIRGRIPAEATLFVREVLSRDLMMLCLATSYKDLIWSTYYDELSRWYFAGHLPCGWIGEVPDDMENAFLMGKIAVL